MSLAVSEICRRRPAIGTLPIVILVVILLLAGLLIFAILSPLTFLPHPSASTLPKTSSSPTTESYVTTLDGASYYLDNVSNIMMTDLAFHFRNASVTFHGVEFMTVCPSQFSGCPGYPPPSISSTTVQPSGSGITLTVTFADGTNEQLRGSFPIVPVHFQTFTLHANPQAGVLISYDTSNPGWKSYLVISKLSSDAYDQVSASYANRLLKLEERNVPGLASQFANNATVQWEGKAGACYGNYTGSTEITKLLNRFLSNVTSLVVSNETQTVHSQGDRWIVSSSFSLAGNSTTIGEFKAKVAEQASYIRVNDVFVIAGDIWNFTYYSSDFLTRFPTTNRC